MKIKIIPAIITKDVLGVEWWTACVLPKHPPTRHPN